MIPTLGIFMSLNDPQWGNRGGNDGDKPTAVVRAAPMRGRRISKIFGATSIAS
jgi:hypothetical protein